MANPLNDKDSVHDKFFEPLHGAYPDSEHQYRCKGISDTDYARLGVLRCISSARTGHGFLQNHGIYFITGEKLNSAAEQISGNLLDAGDPRNGGIILDACIGAGSQQMRRIVYRDPRDGKLYTYITNELTLPAFALVLIYKHRWDLEKVFHQFKSKFNERKSWASSPVAREAQAIFECLAHNLCLLIEHRITSGEGMVDEAEARKKAGRAKSRVNRGGVTLGQGGNYINQAIQRATHRTQRFIRWLGSQVYKRLPWRESLALLAVYWGTKTT